MPYRKRNKPNRTGSRKCEDRLGTSLAYRKEINELKELPLVELKYYYMQENVYPRLRCTRCITEALPLPSLAQRRLYTYQ